MISGLVADALIGLFIGVFFGFWAGVITFFILLLISIVIIFEYERAIVFMLGKYEQLLEPGLHFRIPILHTVMKVDTRITTIDIPKQEIITKDNVTVKVEAVVYFRVTDPEKAVLEVGNYIYAVSNYAQAALRDIVGGVELDEVLENREEIAERIKTLVDKEIEGWGVDIISIKIQDIELPQDMKRVMARQAEAERERRASIIKSEGEVIAAKNLAKAAKTLANEKGALHLRTLQTISDISQDPSQKYIFTIPLELVESYLEAKKKEK